MLANHLVTYTDGSSKLFENSELYKLRPDIRESRRNSSHH